jgi:hypothetical protein
MRNVTARVIAALRVITTARVMTAAVLAAADDSRQHRDVRRRAPDRVHCGSTICLMAPQVCENLLTEAWMRFRKATLGHDESRCSARSSPRVAAVSYRF